MPPDSRSLSPIDLNILPEHYRPRVASSTVVLLWVLAGALMLLVIPTFWFGQRNRQQTADLETSILTARETLAVLRTPLPEVISLTEQLSETLASIEIAGTVQPTALARRDWPETLNALLAYDGDRMQLTALYQDRDNLSVHGLALAQDDVLTYASRLESTGFFQQVLIQSMRGLTETVGTPFPGATPSLSGTVPIPPTPRPSPTPPPYDAYEVDDFDPQPITPGEVQWHSFYPVYDVDRLVFTGKAGRRYCILIVPQEVGVDPRLHVTVGGRTYTNDDCHADAASFLSCECPATTPVDGLSALVEAQVPSGADQDVQVTIENRGQYGPNQWYTVLVSEVTGDPWERDDAEPVPIVPGEAQLRTFYPDGDIDRVWFAIKAGRAYDVRTTELAVGVDTNLSVDAAGKVYANDDAAPGNSASRVGFQAIADGVAHVTVTNKGTYGVDRAYTLQVIEVGGDAHEPDDYTPGSISPSEQQRRTFFPEGDVDRVEFRVKAGRVYELRTFNLAVGVDTEISVLLDGKVTTNDDVSAGDRASRVVFTAARDGVALATVSNKDQYGTDKEYWLALMELPEGSEPGCTDAHEPDNDAPKPIAVGEARTHNFCPEGDIDRAVFTAKAGYAYQIETSDLALGVDTQLTVQLGDLTLANDDKSPQDLGSVIRIHNVTDKDLPAHVAVTNKGAFGETMTYTLSVANLGEGDIYEPDTEEKRYLSVGDIQLHTFYPDGDMDRVFLKVKAGRRYAIFTCGNPYQAGTTEGPDAIPTMPVPTTTPIPETEEMCMPLIPGVDTVVAASGPIGACDPGGCQSDDAYPGTGLLNSRLEFDALEDGEVTVTILNKGLFGPSMFYYLLAQEINPTAAAMPLHEATPAPYTASVAPTAVAPAQSPDLRAAGLGAPMPEGLFFGHAMVLPQSGQVIEFVLLLKMGERAP